MAPVTNPEDFSTDAVTPIDQGSKSPYNEHTKQDPDATEPSEAGKGGNRK